MVNVYEPGLFEGHVDQWPVLSVAGTLEVRMAETEAEVEAAQRLRYRVFYEEMSAIPSPAMRESRRDFDKFDSVCDHILVVDRAVLDDDGQPVVVGTYRVMRDVDAVRAGGILHRGRIRYWPDADRCRTGFASARTRPFLRAEKLSRQTWLHAAAVARRDGLCRTILDRPDVRLCVAAGHRYRIRSLCRFPTCTISMPCPQTCRCARGPSFMST